MVIPNHFNFCIGLSSLFILQRNSTMKVLFVLAVAVVALTEAFHGADVTKWTSLQCRDGSMGPNDARMKDIGACGATHGPEPGKKNPNCVFFCQGAALGLLNDKGLPEQAIYDQWVKTTFPERHVGVGTAWFRDCFQKYGKFIDKNDATCKFAKSFGDCTWGVVPHLTCPKA